MKLTAELVARVERMEPDPGPEPGTAEYSDAEYDAIARALLAEYTPQQFWVFAYGSLIWNPEFTFLEKCNATAKGWHRSFCFKVTRWRGTREMPGLMLALDRGGSCKGLAYRLPDDDHLGQIGLLLRRELDDNPSTNVARWISVEAEKGTIRALAFVATPKGHAYSGKQPLEKVAHVLARAAGSWGSTAQYLFRTVSMLENHGIRDRNLWKIQELVAAEIEKGV